jgi:hypothetical protein
VSIGEQQTKRNIDWEAHLLWQQNSKPKKKRQDQYENEIEAQILARSTKQQTGHA